VFVYQYTTHVKRGADQVGCTAHLQAAAWGYSAQAQGNSHCTGRTCCCVGGGRCPKAATAGWCLAARHTQLLIAARQPCSYMCL
jgi:hypothetical protein